MNEFSQTNETSKYSGSGGGPANPVAVIDIGTNAIRMVVAQVLEEGRYEVLERFQRAVWLGQDTFRRGRIGAQCMRATVEILRDYVRVAREYRIGKIRAVATSSLREAANADNVLDRIYLACGLNVEIISIAEEGRLTVAAVREAVGELSEVNRGHSLVADVGGGSTILTILDEGEIVNSVGVRFGSVRLLEMLSARSEPTEKLGELFRQHIRMQVATVNRTLPLAHCDSFVAVGGDVRFAAREVGCPTHSEDLLEVPKDRLEQLIDRCVRCSPEELCRRFNLTFAEAETLVPALLMYWELLAHTQAARLLVAKVSMRDGVLAELARETTGSEDQSIREGILHAAYAMAERYCVDLQHARISSEIAVRLFDYLQSDHGLQRRHRFLLQIAAILHEVGGFISPTAHHKHSYYIIANSEIFGLTRQETEIIAHIARYHRRSPPKPSHTEYTALPRESRVVVNKLAAVLRVADALARGNIHSAEQVEFGHDEDELFITIRGLTKVFLEKRSVALKSDMFEDVYGMKVRVE